jgi:hypothetical protein
MSKRIKDEASNNNSPSPKEFDLKECSQSQLKRARSSQHLFSKMNWALFLLWLAVQTFLRKKIHSSIFFGGNKFEILYF